MTDGEPLAAVVTVKAGKAASTQFVRLAQDLAVPCDPLQRGGSPFPGLPSQEGAGRQKQHKGGGGNGSWSLRSQHTQMNVDQKWLEI